MLSDYSLDTFFAPELSKLTACGAAELPQREENWLPRFALNMMLRYRIEEPNKQYIFAFLRKVEAAREGYKTARVFLQGYFEGGEGRMQKYFRALDHFEHCLAMSYQAMEIVRKMTRAGKFFDGSDENDTSVPRRIYELYIAGKHVDDLISQQAYPDPQATLVVWLTNAGIKSKGWSVTFEELRELLGELADSADMLLQVAISGCPANPASDRSITARADEVETESGSP